VKRILGPPIIVVCLFLLGGCTLKGGSIPPYQTLDVGILLRPDFTDVNLTQLSIAFHYHYDADGDSLTCDNVVMSRSDYGGQYTLLQPGWRGTLPKPVNGSAYACTYHHSNNDLSFSVPVHQPPIIVSPQANQTIREKTLTIRLQSMVDKVSVSVSSKDGHWSSSAYPAYVGSGYIVSLASAPPGAATIHAIQTYDQMLPDMPFHSVAYAATAEGQVPLILAVSGK
jgi:hypothetical protein